MLLTLRPSAAYSHDGVSQCPSNYEEALAYVYGFYRDALRPASRSIQSREFLRQANLEDLSRFPNIIQVTGTNAKGTTCAYVEEALLSRGHHTVCVTSPHLYSIRERIRIDGRILAKDRFVEAIGALFPTLESLRGTAFHPGPFLVAKWLAFYVHHTLGTQYRGIYEVGSGGGSDGTNVFTSSTVGLTTISEDHLDIYGGSIRSLAMEKLALCQDGGTLVQAEQNDEVQSIVQEYCALHRITPLSAGPRLIHNAALLPDPRADARGLASALLKASGYTDCLCEVALPCRSEIRQIQGRRFILDGAHNPAAVRSLLSFLKASRLSGRTAAIISFQEKKAWREMIKDINASNLFQEIAFTSSSRGRPVEPHALASCLGHGTQCRQARCMKCALKWALSSRYDTFIVFGSFLSCSDVERAVHALRLPGATVTSENIDPEQPWMRPLC